MIWILGSSGQLGQSFKKYSQNKKGVKYLYSIDLDLRSKSDIDKFGKYLDENDIVLNFAAYTNVKKAKEDKNDAFVVNGESVRDLGNTCNNKNAFLIHISTDYVFDGNSNTPYLPDSQTNPINEYGKSKLLGETLLKESCEKYVIIRTSWLYSEFGTNFVKTMLSLSHLDELKVVDNQVGSPTFCRDLVLFIDSVIKNLKSLDRRVLHYSNDGQCSWYEFAKEIFKNLNSNVKLVPVKGNEFDPEVARPLYSVLDKNNSNLSFDPHYPKWKSSLKDCIKEIRKQHD